MSKEALTGPKTTPSIDEFSPEVGLVVYKPEFRHQNQEPARRSALTHFNRSVAEKRLRVSTHAHLQRGVNVATGGFQGSRREVLREAHVHERLDHRGCPGGRL